MGQCAVFIDGGYFEKLQQNILHGQRIDFQKLAGVLAEPETLFRAYYYHCLPFQSDQPSMEERKRYRNRRKFYDALNRLDRFEVRLGRLAFRGTDATGNPIFEQKQIDLMLGLDMAFLAARRPVERIAIVSGDADLIPAIRRCKEENVIVTLCHGPVKSKAAPARELYDVVDERRVIDTAMLPRIRT